MSRATILFGVLVAIGVLFVAFGAYTLLTSDDSVPPLYGTMFVLVGLALGLLGFYARRLPPR